MVAYKYAQAFKANSDAEFDRSYLPGNPVKFSGIYRCTTCGDEIASNKGTVFPAQNHSQHRAGSGPIRWQLIAAAIQS